VTRSGTVEVGSRGIVNALSESEVFALSTGGEESIRGLVARKESRALGDGVVVGTPLEHDSITDIGIDEGGNIAEDTLRRSDNYGVGGTFTDATGTASSLARRTTLVSSTGSAAELSHTFGDTVVVSRLVPGTGTIAGRRSVLRLHGGRSACNGGLLPLSRLFVTLGRLLVTLRRLLIALRRLLVALRRLLIALSGFLVALLRFVALGLLVALRTVIVLH
jgi:hypothetical protein